MTQEEKQLLLVDLCARLPYGIFVKENRESLDDSPIIYTFDYHPYINNCKPYLRPILSMTGKEVQEYNEVIKGKYHEAIDWLNKHYFDYRGLIPMNLALPAPEGMYNKI